MPITDLFIAGGVVMWPLLGFSIVTVALAIERIQFWYQVNRRQQQVIGDALVLYQQDPYLAINKLKQNADLPLARIFLEALALENATLKEFSLALEGATEAEIPILRRFSAVFETIVALAPLLGLLGTVIGLIQSFGSLNLGSIDGTKTISVTAGISKALICTATALIVATIALVFANTFRAYYVRQLGLIQEYSTHLEILYQRSTLLL
ncbi:MAG: MotA/TolQ/ExbB proton channel family protein [Microcoleus sp. SIO2G3]|nr:MotA/TolQ/ExbB proton channel family protein [Microcoleus sp. SIO2G3]